MSSQAATILYLGARLPARSETFVYREVFALRDRGCPVHVASVHIPERGLGSDRLEALADEAVPIYGRGAGRLVWDACRAWSRQPVRATWVLGLACKDALVGRGVPLIRRPKLLVQCVAALALDQRALDLPLTHIHAHMAHVPTSIGMYLALLRRIPFSFTGHAADLFRDYSLLPDKIRRAAFVACISHWHQDFYRQQVPSVSLKKLPIVRCGVELARRAAGSQVDVPLAILAVGRLVEKKGFDVLIRALAGIHQQECRFVCRLVGEGPERQRLESLARGLGLTEHIRFEGARDNQTVQQWMSEADLFVLPCRPTSSGDRDGIPVVLMEAMAAGVPVISGDLPTIRELIQDRQTGRLVAPGRDDILRQAILELIQNADLRTQLGQNGRRWIADEFSQQINIDRLTKAFALDGPIGEAECREPQLC